MLLKNIKVFIDSTDSLIGVIADQVLPLTGKRLEGTYEKVSEVEVAKDEIAENVVADNKMAEGSPREVEEAIDGTTERFSDITPPAAVMAQPAPKQVGIPQETVTPATEPIFISCYDVIRLAPVWDAVEMFLPQMYISGTEVQCTDLDVNDRVFFPTVKVDLEAVDKSQVQVVMLRGNLEVETAENIYKPTSRFSLMAAMRTLSATEYTMETLEADLKKLLDPLFRNYENIKGLSARQELLCRNTDAQKFDTDNQFCIRYMQGLLCTTRLICRDQALKLNELIMPYNKELTVYFKDSGELNLDKLAQKDLGCCTPENFEYTDVVAYFNRVLEEDEDISIADNARDYSDQGIINTKLAISRNNGTAIDEFLNTLDFKLQYMGDTDVGIPVANSEEIFHIPSSYPHCNCFIKNRTAKQLYAMQSKDFQNEDALNKMLYGNPANDSLPLGIRERVWLKEMKIIMQDCYVFDKDVEVFSAEKIDKETNASTGVGLTNTSGMLNNIIREALSSVLALTRGYTGRAIINLGDYVKQPASSSSGSSSEETDEVYDSYRTCFYENIEGSSTEFRQTEIPVEYGMGIGLSVSKNLKNSIINFANEYVTDPLKWCKILLLLLREGDIKPVHIVLDEASKNGKQIYLNLNTSEIVASINSKELTKFSNKFEIAGLHTYEFAQGTKCEFADGPKYESNILGDAFELPNGVPLAFDLWTTSDSPAYSKVVTVDIFGLLEILNKNRDASANNQIEIQGIRFNQGSHEFEYEDPEYKEAYEGLILSSDFRNVMTASTNTKEIVEDWEYTDPEDRISKIEYREWKPSLKKTSVLAGINNATHNKWRVQDNEIIEIKSLQRFDTEYSTLEDVIKLYTKFKNKPLPPTVPTQEYADSKFTAEYTVELLKLLSHCQSEMKGERFEFIRFINLAQKYLSNSAGSGSGESGSGGSGSDESGSVAWKNIIKKIKIWKRVTAVIQNNKTSVCLIGEFRENETNKYFIVEATSKTLGIREEIQAAIESKKAELLGEIKFQVLMQGVLLPHQSMFGKSILFATEDTLQFLVKVYKTTLEKI